MSTPPSYISGVRSGGFTYTKGESVDVVSGGVAFNMVIDKGAFEYLDGGGSATNTIVHKGGEVDLDGAGAYASATLLSGGIQSVTSGAAYSTKVFAGGIEDVSSAGVDYNTTINKKAGEHVYSGGISYAATVDKGGTDFLTQGGTASGATVDAGGRFIVAGDVLYDENFTATSGSFKAVGVYSGGIETITINSAKKGTYDKVTNTATSDGYIRRYYLSNGTVELELQRVGNELYVTSGGSTFSSTSPRYANAGSATNVSVTSGGSVVLAGGTITNLSIASGGTEIIGGKTTVHSAGATYKFMVSGVTVSNSAIGNGVKQIIEAGNIALGATISAGGQQIVNDGATAENSIIDGGKLTLGATAHLAGAATFKGTGGELVIDSKTMPTATISGFAAGDKIQLAGVTYAAGATAVVKTAGVVTITDGGASYALNIAGATASEKFSFGPGSILTTTAAAQMQFLAPAETAPGHDELSKTPSLQAAAASALGGWVKATPIQGAAYALVTSSPHATPPIPITLSGGSSY